MREVLWFIWKRKKYFYSLTFLIFLGVLFCLYKWYNIASNDPLALFAKILGDLSEKVPGEYPFIYLILSLILPALLTLSLGFIIKYHLLPGKKSVLLDALFNRCSEVAKLGFKQIEKDIENVSSFVDGLRTGYHVSPEACQILGRQVIEITKAKMVYATCLQTPQELHDNLKGFSEIITEEINKRAKTLIRIIICDSTIFNLNIQNPDDKSKIKWFVKLHTGALTLKYIEQKTFLEIADACGVIHDKLDIMLFDKKVVYSLENDKKTLKIILTNEFYNLYLMDFNEDVDNYSYFMKKLVDKSTDVQDYIKEKGWTNLY